MNKVSVENYVIIYYDANNGETNCINL